MYKFANCTTSVRNGRSIVRIQEGDAWHADDEFVRSHPLLFSDAPPKVFGQRATRRVESATSAPGETRGTKRSAG